MLWWLSSFVRKKIPHSIAYFLSNCGPIFYMILFGFPCYFNLGAINRCSLHVFQYLSTSDTQSIMTFHLFSTSFFLKSNSFSACSRCFIPSFVLSSFCGHRQRDTGWGCLWPVPDPTALCVPWPPPRSAMCRVGGAPPGPLPRVALFPIHPLSEKSVEVCSHFLTEAEGEFWEQDVEILQCISERERKKELLAVISTLLVFPFFKPR